MLVQEIQFFNLNPLFHTISFSLYLFTYSTLEISVEEEFCEGSSTWTKPFKEKERNWFCIMSSGGAFIVFHISSGRVGTQAISFNGIACKQTSCHCTSE